MEKELEDRINAAIIQADENQTTDADADEIAAANNVPQGTVVAEITNGYVEVWLLAACTTVSLMLLLFMEMPLHLLLKLVAMVREGLTELISRRLRCGIRLLGPTPTHRQMISKMMTSPLNASLRNM